MINNLTPTQEEFFLDVYKVALSGMLSSNDFSKNDSIMYKSMINDAVLIAANSVDLLMGESHMNRLDTIKNRINNERIDKPFVFPDINDDK